MLEDDYELAEVLSEYLEDLGMSIETEEDPFKALSRLKLEKFDLVILDLTLPGMDGLEVCKTLKENPATQKSPVVFGTANVDKEAVSKGIRLGAYYYLTKPVDLSCVLAIVSSALSQLAEYKTLQDEVQKAVSTMNLLDNGCFHFRTIEETRDLALILARSEARRVGKEWICGGEGAH